MKNIYIASDHAGVKEKEIIIKHIKQNHKYHLVHDLGPGNSKSVDYPFYAYKVSKLVQELLHNSCGILICGTGIGMDMVANKFDSIRAARCLSVKDAKLSREHNNANVICLGAKDNLVEYDILEIIDTFLTTDFSDEERHHRRVDLIYALDYYI